MRVVLDTNVIVSAVFWGGTPLRVLEQWALNRIEVFASPEIWSECRRVLLLKSATKTALEAEEWLEFMRKRLRMIIPHKTVVLCRDPHDDKFLSCAVSVPVDYLISGDHDLLTVGFVEGIPVVSPGSFLRILAAQHDTFGSDV